MKITIEAEPKEIAALVLAVQERRTTKPLEADIVKQYLKDRAEALGNIKP